MPTKKKSVLDLGLVPGTPAEQRDRARDMLARGEHPVAIEKVGRGRYDIVVVGTTIGSVSTKARACSVAHQVGHYRLRLGDFAYAYVKGWNGCGR